jgi:hypothetical protein
MGATPTTSGYPDSHLATHPSLAGRPRLRRMLVLAPFVMLLAWFGYAWFVSGVVAVKEKYPGGTIKTEGYIRRVWLNEYKRHGHWVTYHANGQKESEGNYKHGEKVGTWSYWDDDGRPRPGPD